PVDETERPRVHPCRGIDRGLAIRGRGPDFHEHSAGIIGRAGIAAYLFSPDGMAGQNRDHAPDETRPHDQCPGVPPSRFVTAEVDPFSVFVLRCSAGTPSAARSPAGTNIRDTRTRSR